jgi:hypothetical protein
MQCLEYISEYSAGWEDAWENLLIYAFRGLMTVDSFLQTLFKASSSIPAFDAECRISMGDYWHKPKEAKCWHNNGSTKESKSCVTIELPQPSWCNCKNGIEQKNHSEDKLSLIDVSKLPFLFNIAVNMTCRIHGQTLYILQFVVLPASAVHHKNHAPHTSQWTLQVVQEQISDQVSAYSKYAWLSWHITE